MLNIVSLKTNFESVKSLRNSIIELLTSLELKVTELKYIYSELLTNNKSINSLLDTLYFQTKLITLELKNVNDIFIIIDNRIYGDYYKLYKMIVKYCKDNYTDNNILKILSNNFKTYNDLDFTTEYEFSLTEEVYNTIMSLMEMMTRDLNNRNINFVKDETKKTQGIDIDNLIHNQKFNNTILNENIELFKHYTEAYNKFHKKYFSSFFIKVKLFYSQVDRDINIRKSPNIKNSKDNICIKENDVYDIKELISDNSESSSITEEINNIFPNNVNTEEYNNIKSYNDNQEDIYIRNVNVEQGNLIDLSNCYILESSLENVFYSDDVQIKQYRYISNFKSYCNII
tara:strand:+ start:86 stop:1114 length:1029 start_codon:yes stop_codon:yes gene_type:complete